MTRHYHSCLLTAIIIIITIITLTSCVVVNGLPYMMLYSTRPKCMNVIATNGQTLLIQYDVPDIKLIETNDNNNDNKKEIQDQLNDNNNDKRDERWNSRMKEKLQLMKEKELYDMTITITPKLSSLYKQRIPEDDPYRPTRIRQNLFEVNGTIEYRSPGQQIDICIQSISATKIAPSRFGLLVSLKDGGGDGDDDPSNENNGGSDSKPFERGSLQREMTRLERDIGTLSNRIQTLTKNAEFNKEYEKMFFEQSTAMHQASTYWPIIQLTVLVIAGITQANHIVRYMRSRHIV